MFKLLIVIIAIAKMTEGVPIINYPFYDPSIETDTVDDQDFIGNEVFKIIDDAQSSNSFDLMSPIMPQIMEKRERHISDPCSCPHKVRYENNGDNAYPRHYRTKVCDAEKIRSMSSKKTFCFYGGKCKEFYYEVHYLVPKRSDGLLEHHLPSEINKLYGWVSKNISIDCRCLH